MSYTSRYGELFRSRGTPVLLVNGKLFRVYNRMVIPEGPASEDFTISREEQKKLVKQTKALLFRGTGGFTKEKGKGYYVVIADHFTEQEKITDSKTRYEVKRALKLNQVKRLQPGELAEEGYDVYRKAITSYKGFTGDIISAEKFKDNVRTSDDFSDIIHYWGVYHGGKLVGYSSNYIYGKEEVNYSQIKYDPAYFNKGISYALVYKMNEYYLKSEGFRYVSDGYVSLQHESNVQQFFERNFGFFRQPVRLEVTFGFPYNLIILLGFPFRKLLYWFDGRFKALYQLKELADEK